MSFLLWMVYIEYVSCMRQRKKTPPHARRRNDVTWHLPRVEKKTTRQRVCEIGM